MTTQLPRVGMRLIKTSLAVLGCFIIHFLRNEHGVPVFSTIAALMCMQTQVENSIQSAFNRIVGTVIGALFALPVVALMQEIPWEFRIFRYVLVAAALIPVMYTTVALKRRGAADIAGMVLLSVCLSNGGQPPHVDAINRSLETIIGILVSLGVNSVQLPRKRTEKYLFVASFDGALYDRKNGITPYVQFEMNQMLRKGLPFTIATERTPAFLMSEMKGLNVHLPVVAMDGAVLYDMKDKRYLITNGLRRELADAICQRADSRGFHYFRNVVWQNVLLIFYNDFANFKSEAEKDTYLSNRRSPYRNYVEGEVPPDGNIVYILLVLRDGEADAFEAELREMDTEGELLFLRDKEETHEGYCHFKIYHKNATKAYMLEQLMERLPQKEYIAFGSGENDISMLRDASLSYATAEAIPEAKAAADYRLKKQGSDHVIRKIQDLYERLPWQKLPKKLREPEKRKG
ncbi:MAG: HAD hydrolase family protein [Bacillota bacterium]|nr:HAD hydrolase family protein [Bacillota bacterium]